ncbi:glycosyl hydrolases family 18-domain-containing protein [Kalaharituber pfeilii]|nr:glycosyl hydrolases family 18-domain-containing protein [Kalaharituber pfeilii]
MTRPFDYSVKEKRWDESAPICPASAQDELLKRQVTDDDYSCSETKPCSNKACCSKLTGYCNYGPEACGTSGVSPNEVCWSNCDAKAECGRFADPPGKKCPLNVCCSQYGFCGMTADFCTKGDAEGVGCQSNCDQPGSGASGGDVQKKIIGYYEAWAHDRSCAGMDFNKIPVGALTHLVFSFGFITPDDFNIVPMDGLPESLFNDLTSVKKRNSGLKCMIALGGWTFNDPGPFQPVFSTMVATKASRSAFIVNLISFMREFAFDGVDFDWEYPGADDRGGHAQDGENFTQFLKELREALDKEPLDYVVSFTVPTSYWYLRHFDLASVKYVDWVNVMSYDLHGTWDSNNPIGSKVLAHTNLTEIKQALDLFWRNSVPANKLNIGIGFYGRSFQLADPTCYRPGCVFKGGAAPGGCSGNSGTLTYKEIMEIIQENGIKPYYDENAAVKYIHWNQDQWVSYDDEETMKAKIKFANNLGLGGLLIWAIDQDTLKLDALKGVLAPRDLDAFQGQSDKKSYWDDMTAQDCYVTDCGGKCKAGFIKVTTQPCGDATPVFRHSSEDDSTLCCPIAAAPDPNTCRWRGTAPSCNGHCEDGEVMVQMNRWGSGAYCEDGNKAYCCDVPAGKETKCYWTGHGGSCNTGDKLMTFAGTFLQTVADIASWGPLIGDLLEAGLNSVDLALTKRFCCPPDEAKQWTNCDWHGEPGSCFDNHCDQGHQVQLAQSDYGAGASCAPRLERTRVYCCDPADGKSPFLPVPLDRLFPNPPEGNDVATDFDLQLDNTWGDGHADTSSDNDPDDATFAFWVLTSPEEIQVSLRRRDGSHWEVFNCNDAVSEDEHTVQMVCTDLSENSNCGKIYLGHGVSGTIVEMPKGCGPSKYAVAKSLVPAENQTLPHHLVKRYPHLAKRGAEALIYDFTFDYEWMRVPRDQHETQMRVDFSNEVGYWDNIVAAAAKRKRKLKRSLADTGGSHKRWLEDEWRDDFHFGALSKEELHKRWFGQDIIDWLRGLLNPNIKPEFTHNLNQQFTAIIAKQKWGPCQPADGGPSVEASIDIRATANVDVSASWGLTIICTLALPLDLSKSYLFFKTKGDVSAVFTLDAMGRAVYESGDKELIGLQDFPGATFSIPKILTVGPNFKLHVALDADVTVAGHMESRVDIASWEIRQTYPNQGDEFQPKTLDSPNRQLTLQGLRPPTFDWSVKAYGQMTAHLKPSFIFGIDFDKRWRIDGSAKVAVTGDGWIRLHAEAEASSQQATCPFTYGIEVGADLYAIAEAPKPFGWNALKLPIASMNPKTLVDGNTCPTLEERALQTRSFHNTTAVSLLADDVHTLTKRTGVFGPIIPIPKRCLFCPPKTDGMELGECGQISGWDQEPDPAEVSNFRRDLGFMHPRDLATHYGRLQKRASKDNTICAGIAKMVLNAPRFDSSGPILSVSST